MPPAAPNSCMSRPSPPSSIIFRSARKRSPANGSNRCGPKMAVAASEGSGIPRYAYSVPFPFDECCLCSGLGEVENFIALDPLNRIVKAAASGVALKPWTEMVEPVHQPIFRWYARSMTGAWKYQNAEKFRYGDDTTYQKGIAFLDGHGFIEDWGCGFAHARSLSPRARTAASMEAPRMPTKSWICESIARRPIVFSCTMSSSTTRIGAGFWQMPSLRLINGWP